MKQEMASDLDHVLLTRFNLPSKGHESVVRAQENWLKNRVGLFERHCLPSVAAQTCQDFSWIIYFDPQSPPWLFDWVEEYRQQGSFCPLLREEVSPQELVEDIGSVVGPRHGRTLLTTNLDNDDSLAADFIARVQAVAPLGGRTAIYLADGLIRREGVLYRRVDPHNAFCSVREAGDRPVTCWADWHNLLPELMPAAVVRGSPGWLQVVHGANVSNRVRGRRTHPSAHRSAFPGLLDGLPDPVVRELATDLFVSVPARVLREGGRAAAKTVLTKVAGKQGLDRVKLVLSSTRR